MKGSSTLLTVSEFMAKHTIELPKELKFTTYRLLTDNEHQLQESEESLRPTLMGTLIDYLTRIVIYHDLQAFNFIKSNQAKTLIRQLKKEFKDIDSEHLTIEKIKLVTRLCCFEHQFRGNENIDPLKENIEIDVKTFAHIKVMLNRVKNFFTKVGYPLSTQYKCLITTPLNEDQVVQIYGDGDYILKNALVDFKVSKNSPKRDYIRQLLIYYVGLVESELKKKKIKKEQIKELIIFNPRLDSFYKIDLDCISTDNLNKVIQNINLELLAIKETLQREKKKNRVNRKRRAISTKENAEFLRNPFLRLKDGIHEVSREDYKRFYGDKLTSFKYPGQVILIKKNGYYMFFLKTDKKEYMLEGGTIHNISHSFKYYYSNMDAYATNIEKIFSQYHENLTKIAKEVHRIGGEGKVHGAIIDIDYFNHIYFEPADGSLKYYFARDVLSRNVYPNLSNLLEDPNTTVDLPEYKKRHKKILGKLNRREKGLLNNSKVELLTSSPQNLNNLIYENENYIQPVTESGYNKEMYHKSKVMNQVQYLYEHKVIRFWRDGVVKNKYSINSQQNGKENYKSLNNSSRTN